MISQTGLEGMSFLTLIIIVFMIDIEIYCITCKTAIYVNPFLRRH